MVYSGCGSHDYFKEFQKQFPKIKLVSVSLSCTQLVSRIMAERRAGKYLADVIRFGLTSAHTFYRAKVLQPIDAAFILPEVKEPSKWWQNKHHYSDPEGKYLIIPAASIYERFASYHAALANPSEFKSFVDVLNPKWKGKIVATDPKTGEGRNGARFLYHHPELGPQYLRRLLSEMDITYSRDYRQATDWLAQKRFALYLFSQVRRHAQRQKPGTAGTDSRHRQLEGGAGSGRHRRRLSTHGQTGPSQCRKDSRQLAALPRRPDRPPTRRRKRRQHRLPAHRYRRKPT